MKIVIDNVTFPYDTGVRLLKLKHTDCPSDFAQLADIWDKIVPMNFKDIAELDNLEERQIGIVCLGLDRLVKEIKPVLINTKTLKKTTTFIDKDGKKVTKKFDDTYELYKVPASYFTKKNERSWGETDAFFVKCKDTSTDREYMLWIQPSSVYATNYGGGYVNSDEIIKNINAIQAIAWTIQTNVPVGNIEKIIRQGDCIIIKPKKMEGFLEEPRHITEKEYKTLLVAES